MSQELMDSIRLIQNRTVYLPGGIDKENKPIVVVNINSDAVVFDLTSSVEYIKKIFSDENQRIGFTFIVDARKGPCKVTKTCIQQLSDLSSSEGSSKIIVLRPEGFWDKQRVENCTSLQNDSNVTYISPSRLNKYVEPAQLPFELGGLFVYDHEQWLSNRLKIDSYYNESKTAINAIEEILERITSCQENYNANDYTSIINSKIIDSTKDVANQALIKGHDLLEKVEHDNRNRKFASESEAMTTPHDVTDTIKKLEQILTDIRKKLNKLDETWRTYQKTDANHKDLNLLQEGIVTVINWIFGPAENLLNSQYKVGHDVPSAEELRNYHEAIEMKCWETYGVYAKILHRIKSLESGSTLTNELKNLLWQRDFMNFVCRTFAARLERRRNILITSLRLFRLVSEYFDKTGEVFESLVMGNDTGNFSTASQKLRDLQDSHNNLDAMERELRKEGEKLSDMLSMPVKDSLGRDLHVDYSEDIVNIKDILDATTARKNLFSDSVELQKLTLEQVIHIASYEEDARQAVEWLNELFRVMLRHHAHVGSTVYEIQLQKDEHQLFQETAKDTYNYGNQLLNASMLLRQSCKLPMDDHRSLVEDLTFAWQRLLSVSQEQMTRLRVSAVFHRTIEDQCNQLRDLREAVATLPLEEAAKKQVRVRNFISARENLMVEVGRMVRLGRLLRSRLKEPLYLNETLSENDFNDEDVTGFRDTSVEDNQVCVEAISEKLTEVTELAEELDQALKSAQQDCGLDIEFDSSASSSLSTTPTTVVQANSKINLESALCLMEKPNPPAKPTKPEELRSDEEFQTASECTLQHSRSSSYNTASECEHRFSPWWEHGKEDTRDHISKEKMVLGVGLPDLPPPRSVLKPSPEVPPGKIVREVTETTHLKVVHKPSFDVSSYVLTSEVVRDKRDMPSTSREEVIRVRDEHGSERVLPSVYAGEKLDEEELTKRMRECGDWLDLKVLEITPDLASLGNTLQEALDLQKAHDEVLRQLQNKQSPVEELLRQADHLISTQKPRAEVYAAMAESLGRAWKDINLHLEFRKQILDLNVQYHTHARDFFTKVEELEAACKDTVVPIEIDAVKRFLTDIHEIRRALLEAHMNALQTGNSLINKLKELGAKGTLDSRPDRIRTSVNRAIAQVQEWMDELHTKRQILETTFVKRKAQLEQCLALAILAVDLKEVEEAVNKGRDALANSNELGDSSSSAELLLQWHRKLLPEAQQLQERALKITKATEQLEASGCFASEQAKDQAYKVLSTTSDYLTEISEHIILLEKVINFFRTAQTAFTKLDQLEIQLQTTELPSSSPQLARLHAQCAETIANLTTPPIELGHNILREAKPGRGTEGVRRTVEELENRKITLEGLCTAHREDKLRINRALNEFLDKHEELYSWLKSIAEAFLQGHQDMGSDYSLAKDFLDLHNQLLNDLQTKGNEINSLLLTLPPILEYLEDDQRRDVDSKVESLHEHWIKLKNILEKRLDLASIYVKFHSEANRVNDKIDKLEESLRLNAGNTHEDIFRRMEEEWEQIVPLYQSAKNTGITFINETKKMSEPHLDTKRACVCVESVLEKLSNRQVSVTRTWQTYKTDVEERREVHLQWEQIIMQSSKTLNWVTKLESQLYPLIDTFATSPKEIIDHLERKQETVLPEIRRAQNEVEQRIKMTETLISKSSQIDEQSLNIKNKLIELNQKLIEISSEYQILLQVLIGFFKNLVELDKTTENLNSQFGKAGLPKNAADVELLIREHEASRQAVLEMFRFTQNECEQLKSRIMQQEPKTAAEQDISKLETMLETRKVAWEEEWKRRRESLESQKKISHFNSELKVVDENIDELSRQLSGFKEQCRESQSTTKNVAQTFTHFTKVTETLDIRVKNLVNEGEKLVHENHLQSPQIEFNINQLQEKWSNFKKDTQDTKHLIELSTKYYEIVNEADQWLKDGSRILVSVAKRTSAIKRPEEAQQLLHEVENFVKPGQERQTERIHSISQLSKELFSPGWSKEETEIQIQHKEIIESFSSIISELHILSQNLKVSEEQQEKLKREQVEADAKLAAAQAEAERARHAARVAEEEKRAAEEAKRAAEDAKRAAEEAKLTAESAVKTLQESMTSQTIKEIQIVKEEVPQHATAPMVPPVFISPLSDVVIQEGAKFTFMCTVTGTPTPVVTWYKDGISIQNNPDYQTSFEQGLCALTIEETFAEDSARYSCKAVNAAGSAETSAFLAVEEPQQEEQLVPPTFVKLLQPGFAKEGSQFQFECKVDGYPLPTVQWFKGNECIDNSPDYAITYNNGEAILKFEKVTLNDKAEYTCKATNKLGVAQSRTNLNIEPAQPMEAPFFIVPLSNVMARAGQKIKLECEVTGVPEPTLTWTQNGKVFKESRDLKLLREGKRATLVISEAFPKDAGTFAVTASNTAGEAISSCNVTVKGRLPTETSDSELASDLEPIKPTIQVALKDASVFEGQKVRLDCVIVGQPEPEVIWYRDDIPVKESSDFQLLFQGDRCSLIIQEAFSEDAGEYKVVALNSAGEASSKCKLIVTPLSDKQPAPKPPHEEMNATGSPPKFSKLLSDVLVSENERVIFEATVSGQPRPEIKWLLNNQEIIQSNRIVTTYDQQGNVSLQIDSVKPEDRGVYTVKAQNPLGEAKCFAQLIVKTAKPIEIQKPFEDVKSPPFFNERFTDRTVTEDTSTKFECIVTGKPTPKVRWYFNDEPVSGKDFLVSTSGDRQVLTIPTVTKKSEGKITCIAENEAGTSTWSAKLSVQPSLGLSTFPAKPSTEIQRHVESSYILKQDVQVESSSTVKKISSDSEPQVQIHTIKSHDEKSVTQANQEQPKIVESHKVEEYRTFGDHKEQFSSIIDNTRKENEQILTTQKKVIKLRPPKFINPIMGKIVDQNAKVVLEGIVDGQPTPTISWSKNGTELRQTDNVKISYDLGRPKVEILNATSSDAGRYTCTAVNEAGSAVSTSDLVVRKVIFPPVFGRRLQAQVVKKGERIRMEIEVTGTPEPAVSWYKDGIPLTSEPREGRRILRQGNSYTLIIEKAELKDQGKYMVRAVNEGGEAQSIADFAVYEPTPDTMMEVVKTVVFEDVRKHEMLSSTEDKTKSVTSTEQRIPVSSSTFDSSTFALPEIEKSIVTKKEIVKSTTPTNFTEKTSTQSSESQYQSFESRFSQSSESKSESKSEKLFTKESAQPPTIVRSIDSASYTIPEVEKSVVSKTEIFKSSSPINLQEHASKSSESQLYSSKYGGLAPTVPDITPQTFSTVDSARYVFPDGEKSVVSKTEVYKSSTPYGTEEKKVFQTSSSSMSHSHSSKSEKLIKSESSADKVPFPHPEIDKSLVSRTEIFKSSSPINVPVHVSKTHGSQAYSSTFSSQYGDLARKGPEVAPQSFSTIDSAKYVYPDGESSLVSKSEVFKSSTPYGTEEKKVFQTSSSSMSQSYTSGSEKLIKSESSTGTTQFPETATKIFKTSDIVKREPEVVPQNFSTVDSARYVFPGGEKSVVSKSEVYQSSTPYGTQEKKIFQTSSSSMSQSYSSSGDKFIKSESSTDKGTYALPEAPTSLISKTEIVRKETPSDFERKSFLQSSSQSQFTSEAKKEPFTTTIIDSASYSIPEVERSVVSKTEISKTSTPYSHQGETLTSESKSSESSMFSQSQQSFMKETQVSKESKVITLDHTTPDVPKVPSLPKFTVPEVPITQREVVITKDVSGPATTETKKESFVGEAGFQTSSKQSTIDFSVKKIYKGGESESKKEIQHISTPSTYKRYEEISKPVTDTGYKTSTFQSSKIVSSEIPTQFSGTTTTKEEFVLKPEPPPEICYAPVPETHEDRTIKTTIIESHTELPIVDQTTETKSFASAQKHFQELSRNEETHSSRKFETAESVHKRTRSASPKPNQGAIAMEKLWTKQRSFEYETPPSVSSSYSYTVERQTTAPRPVSALSVSSQEQSYEKTHEEKSYSTQSTLEKKWTPFEKRHESRVEKTRIVSAPEPIHYVAEVTGPQHQFKHESIHETTRSESSLLKGESTKEYKEEIKEEVNIKPSQLKKTWPPPSSEEHVSTSTSKIISASASSTPSVHSLSIRPVSVQDITDEVYLEPGPPPEIGYAPPVERRQSYVELIEHDLERNLDKEPAKLPAGAVRTIPPPLPPKNEQYQPPPIPAKPIKFVEPPKKIKKEVESKPFERFPDLEPFPFSPGPEKPKPLRAGPPPTPSKFVKGRFTDSDYESDIEAVRIPAKWKPSASDTEEPSYKRVRPPTVSPSFRSRSVEPEPLPPSKFDQPPESSGPPRPTIDFRKTIKRDAALERKLARHSYPKAQEAPRQPIVPAEPVLKPGSPPIFMEAPQPPRQKPESPKVKHKPILDGYMADTDEPRTLARKTFKEDNVKMEQKQTLYSDANYQKSFEQTRTSHAPAPRVYKKHVQSSTKKELVSTPIITNISTTETVTEKQDRSETRESYNYQTECSKPKRIRGPPPPSPSKFVKGEFRESDYESDYDGKKIPPVWTPQDTPVEKTYKPVRPILTPSGRHSQTSTGRRTPTPPTEFDHPPQISGPPRPKFEPIEKPAPTLKLDKFMKQEERKQVVHKPKPVTAKQQPIADVIIATPAAPEREVFLQPGTPPEIAFAPGPQATQYYKSTTSTPYHNAVQTETSNVMHFKESTENSQRTVSLQQTRKVITFGKQDSSSSSQFSSERRRSAPPPTRPTKFIPGEYRESDYESEVETSKIRPLWVPSESDNEEPRYRKVKPPQPTRSLSLPGQEYSSSIDTRSSCRQESNQSSYFHKMSKEESSRSQSSKQSESSNELVYQPGPRPEYGYMPEKVAKSEATKLASKHMDDMTHSFKSKTQNFVSDIMSDISKKKTSATTDKRNGETDAQVYREDSRAAQYGTKHVDPDTGLIYFKYDFGYEFGIILPGEGKSGEIPVPKKTIIEPPKRSRDIEMPVYHETTKTQGVPTNKLTVPSKTVRWEPTSESEMSEYESDGRKKGFGNRWEQSSASPVSLSPSLPSTSPAFNQYGSGRGVETPTSTPGTSTPGSTSASYSTKKNLQAQRAPLFITPLRDIAVVKGQPARFECIVQSETTPTVLWSKDGMVISNTPNHQIFFRNGVCRLTIPQAYPDDAGTYSCTATNPVGAASTSATLQVPGERRSQYI